MILLHAEYAIVEARRADIKVMMQRVALDRVALARAAAESKNISARISRRLIADRPAAALGCS